MGVSLNPYISVDTVVFGFDDGELKVLLINREVKGQEKFPVKLKLPGGLIRFKEPLDDSALRILEELTGLQNVYLKQFAVFDNPDRLQPENDLAWLSSESGVNVQRVVTIAYYSLIKIDESQKTRLSMLYNAQWHKVDDVPQLIFDHNKILNLGLKRLRHELLTEPLAYEMLPQKFTLNQLQRLYETVLGIPIDNRNFRKKINRLNYIIALNERQQGVSHKPGRLHVFDKALFEIFQKENHLFII